MKFPQNAWKGEGGKGGTKGVQGKMSSQILLGPSNMRSVAAFGYCVLLI